MVTVALLSSYGCVLKLGTSDPDPFCSLTQPDPS